jgi:signal transduction histidine kinase
MLSRPAALRGLDAESRFLLDSGERAERESRPDNALRFFHAAAEAAREPTSRVEALCRVTAAHRRLGNAADLAAAEEALLAAAPEEDRRDRFELLLARIAREGLKDALQQDLLLRVGTPDEPVVAGLFEQAGFASIKRVFDRRRDALALRERVAAVVSRHPGVTEGATLHEGRLLAWSADGTDLVFVEGNPPALPDGVELHEDQPPAPDAASVQESVPVGAPVLGATVHAGTPRTRVEAGARRGAWLLGGALVLLVSGGGGAALLALRGAREEARAASERADFVTRVGHDLRTPLALVRMYAETLAEGRVSDPDEARRFAAIAARESERLTAMVEQVMEFSDGGAPRTPAFVPLDLAALVREVTEAHRPLAGRERVTLVVHADVPLPVSAEPAALRGALGNLLSNALRHGGAGEVTVRASKEGDYAVVEVADRGPGVPAGWEERVFERFVRGPGARGTGVGLGLALVRETLRAHGGRATCAARDGGGFVVRISMMLRKGGAA